MVYTQTMIHIYEIYDENVKFIFDDKPTHIQPTEETLLKKQIDIYGENVCDIGTINVSKNVTTFLKDKICKNGYIHKMEIDYEKLKTTISELDNNLNFIDSNFDTNTSTPSITWGTNYEVPQTLEDPRSWSSSTRNEIVCNRLTETEMPTPWNIPTKHVDTTTKKDKVEVVPFESDEYLNNSALQFTTIKDLVTKQKDADKKLYIYYNNYFETIHILEKEINHKYFPELLFIDSIDEPQKEKLESMFSEDISLSKDEIVNIIAVFKKCNNKNIVDIVKTELANKYEISDSIEHKIKSSLLLKELIKSCEIKENKDVKIVTRNFSKILTDMGLKKKRFNDGNYWYGVKRRDVFTTNDEFTDLNNVSYDKYISKRSTNTLNINEYFTSITPIEVLNLDRVQGQGDTKLPDDIRLGGSPPGANIPIVHHSSV